MDNSFIGRRISRADYRMDHRSDKRKSLQDEFLTQCIMEEIEVDIFLRNESVRAGKVLAYDNWSVLISDSQSKQYLMFKSAIMGIIPKTYVLFDENLPSQYTKVADTKSTYYKYQ